MNTESTQNDTGRTDVPSVETERQPVEPRRDVVTAPERKVADQETAKPSDRPIEPVVERTATEAKVDRPAAPEQEAEQTDPLHVIDQHTGPGTVFPVGSPMAVVPPSKKKTDVYNL